MKVTVVGAGYVGLVTACCLAEMGNSVLVHEVDAERLALLEAGRVPFHEPGLPELLQRNLAAQRLRVTADAAAAVEHGSVLFIAVGTPQGEDGSADTSHVLAAARTIGAHLNDGKVIVDKSTVPVGTAERVRATVAQGLRARGLDVPFAVVSNPEFLKEGSAVEDFMRPDRVIVGCDDERAALLMRALYLPFLRNRDRMLMMDVRSAELAKYAANAMLATRISFMNELSGLAERLGADIEHVRLALGSDARIGTHFLYAGCGWGGSCLPKDVQALLRMGDDEGVPLPLTAAVQAVNERQRRLLVERVQQRLGADLSGRVIGVWGLAFKPGTDDVREAPALQVVDALLAAGAEVQAYDPLAMPAAARRWPGHARLRLQASASAAAHGADALLVMTEWREFRSVDFGALAASMRGTLVLDGRNLYDAHALRAAGLECWGIGRAPAVAAAGGPAATHRTHDAFRAGEPVGL